MKKIMWTLLPFVLIVVIYLILNGGLIGVQNFFKKDEIAKFEKMKNELEDLHYEIEDQENDENEYGYYNDAVNEYNTSLEDYESLVSEYDEKHETYSDSIDAYNIEVKTVNKLSEEIGSTWVIVPIPSGK